MNFRLNRSLSILSLVAVVSAAQAVEIFDNYGPGDTTTGGGRLIQGPDVNTIGDVNQATTFEVGAGNYFLTTIKAGVFAGPNNGGLVTISIAEDNAGTIGTILESSDVNVAGGADSLTAGFSGLTTLMSGKRYWVIADAEGKFDGGWYWNNQGDKGLTAGQSEGFAWNYRMDDDRYALRVEGRMAPVPEPASMIALGCGLLGLARRRRATAK